MSSIDSDTDLEDVSVTVTADTEDAIESLEQLTEAADDARVAIWKLNNALAYLENCRENTAKLQE